MKNQDTQNTIHPLSEIADTTLVLPPAWAFGVLYGGYTNQDQTIETIKKIQEHSYPIDAYWIDSWFWSFDDHGKGPKKYIDFVADTVAYPNRKAMWEFLEENNIKGGFWVWDCILETGNERVYKEFDSLGYFSSKYLNTNPWHNAGTTTAMYAEEKGHTGTWCGNIDFDNPQAVAFFKAKMKHFFDEGADFLKLDRTSSVPVVKAVFEMSQEYGRETKGRGFTISHTGGYDKGEFKRYPTKWTDDTRSDWTVVSPTKEFNDWVPNVAFQENIAMFTDPDNESSQIPFLTNDTGGFDMGLTDQVDEELYIRWLQFSSFNPIMEVFSQPENKTMNLAFNYSERADSIFRKYTHLRMELFPYIYSYAMATRITGVNIIRPVKDHLYEFYFGNEMLIAPVYEQGAESRTVYLPEGNWVDFWNSQIVSGSQEHTFNAPIDRMPVLIKEGSIIPMRPYAASVEAGSNDTIILHVFPGSDGKFDFYEDDGTSNDYLKGIFAKTELQLVSQDKDTFQLVINPVKGYYNGMPERRNWQISIHSIDNFDQMTLGGKKITLTKMNKVVTSEVFLGRTSEKLILEISKK